MSTDKDTELTPRQRWLIKRYWADFNSGALNLDAWKRIDGMCYSGEHNSRTLFPALHGLVQKGIAEVHEKYYRGIKITLYKIVSPHP